ncbi:MAG: DUF4365 domain-containing protein [Bacteroidales bacterium]|nr:DUF4365 domain-containing protein [Bacteroidales bacterium]
MPKQTRPQKIGSLGHSIVQEQITRSKFWIARNLNEDFGIDIELEFAPEEVEGKFVKAQIKSHEKVSTNSDFFSEPLPKSFLRYVHECRIPIILIIVSTNESKTWFVWLQKWLFDSGNISNIYDESESKTLSVQVHINSDFVVGLQNEIISIATWENKTQLYIALRDLANLSLHLYNDVLAKLLFDYLETCKSDCISDANYFDTIIEKVIALGSRIWATHEGNETTQLLFKFIREFGNKLNATHISKLIIRGTDCSRTGINALGILYDNFPKHAESLNLVKKFENFSDPRLHFYCTIRERYLGLKSPSWLLNEKNDLTVGKLKVDFSIIDVYDKWITRGDSVILDYVYECE